MGLFKKSTISKPAPNPNQNPNPGQSSTSISATHHANGSSSNLSTTSTLIPPSSQPAPQRMTSYQAFISDAQATESKRQERLDREEQTSRAWVAARQRRENGRQGDPWRGGFGPPPAGGGSDVGRWLDHNGLVRK